MKSNFKKAWTTLIAVLALYSFSWGQNLIQNGNCDQPGNAHAPGYKAMVDDRSSEATEGQGDESGMDNWECQFKKKGDYHLHSPDWFMDGVFQELIDGTSTMGTFPKLSLEDNGVDVDPMFGNGFIGMGPGELIQQKFASNNRLEDNETYLLRFYIRTTSNNISFMGAQGVINPGGSPDWTLGQTHLKVFLRKSNYEYSTAANSVSNQCDPDTYFDKNNQNNTEQILDLPIDANQYPPGEWHKIEIQVDSPGEDYDWIVFELQRDHDLCDHGNYLLLDGFSLEKGLDCETVCSETDGDIDPNFQTNINAGSLFTISNIGNIQHAQITIYQGTMIILTEEAWCTNGIDHDLYWDGTYSNPNPPFNGEFTSVAPGSYSYSLSLSNDCGSINFSGTINVSASYTGPLNTNLGDGCNNGVLDTPTPCCVSAPDLWIDNVTIPGYTRHEYVYIDNIWASTTVPGSSDAVIVPYQGDVLFRSGKQVTLDAGFDARFGSNFVAEIIPCVDFTTRLTDAETLGHGFNVIEDATREDIGETDGTGDAIVIVFPNPNNGRFTISVNTQFDLGQLDIYDVSGVNVLSKRITETSSSIDISSFGKGVYLAKIQVGGKVVTKKIVYN